MDQQLNRAKTLWQNWEQLEKSINALGNIGQEHPLELARQKYDFLREGLYRLDGDSGATEKPHLALIRAVTDKLEKQLYPNRFLRLLHQLKVLVYDKPKALATHKIMLGQNLADLKEMFNRRGLHELAGKLDHPLDYEKREQSFEFYGHLDRYRSICLTPVLEKDSLGFYQLGDIKAHFYGTDPMNGVDLVIPKEYPINRTQILNLLQDRPVYLHPGLLDGHEGKWLQLDRGIEPGQFGIYAYEPAAGYELDKELAILASQTGISRLTGPDVLTQLQLGNAFQLTGHHSKDLPFLIHADPANRGLVITDLDGRQLSKENLLMSLKHDTSDQTKSIQADLLKRKDKEREPGLDQGQSL